MTDVSKFTHFYSNAVNNTEYVSPENETRMLVAPDSPEANLLASHVPGKDGLHYIFLDLDVPHTYIPSSTEGHAHLIIERPLAFQSMMYLLKTLRNFGVLQDGFVDLTEERGAAFLRHPNTKKPQKEVEEIEAKPFPSLPNPWAKLDGDDGKIDLLDDPWGFNSEGPAPF